MFWDGFLEGIMACEFVAKDAKEIEKAITEIRKLKQQTQRLHTEDLLMFLKQYETE
jgi:hypothetical protein